MWACMADTNTRGLERNDEIGGGYRTMEIERSTSTGHRLNQYDGVCGNIHGHNMTWNIRVSVQMDSDDTSNMPIDLKDISDVVDQLDHALILSEEDPILSIDPDRDKLDLDDAELPISYTSSVMGKLWVFPSDPTCELISKWAAQELTDLEAINHASVKVDETDKYGIEASSTSN